MRTKPCPARFYLCPPPTLRPRAHHFVWVQLRRRYRKIYEDYKPHAVYWKLVLLGRKFLFSVIVVLINTNIELQVRSTELCVCVISR